MSTTTAATTLTPIVAVHMTAAILAIATGPFAIWARKGATQRPKLHRAFGYSWVTLMLVAATSAIFITSELPGHWHGFSLIHLLVIVTYAMLFIAFRFLIKGNITGHRLTMVNLYIGACLVAGVFTLAPGRYLGNLVLNQWLGLV